MDASQPGTPPKGLTLAVVRDFFKNTWRDYIFLFPFAAVIVSFDQWAKAWVRTNVPLGSDWLPGWLSIGTIPAQPSGYSRMAIWCFPSWR